MRALILSHEYADPERRAKLRSLAGLGCSLTVAVPGRRSEFDGPLRIAGVPVRGTAAAPDRQSWNRRAITSLLRDLRPDLIQVEAEPQSRAATAAAAAARRLGIPLVAFSWESVATKRRFFPRRRRQFVLRHAAGVIGGNTLAEGILRAEAPSARHAAIPQFGVAIPAPLPPRQGEGLAIGYIGRLVPERGVDQLLHSLNFVMGPWTLALLGTGPEQEALEAMAQRFGQASRLRWLGGAGRDAMERMWSEIDVLVVPSRATPTWVERYHPILAEAMARGLAVAVMQTGALPELVGDAGIIAADPEALGLGLQTLLAEPERRRALGQAARQRVLSHLSDAAIAERTLGFWQEVLQRRVTSPAAG